MTVPTAFSRKAWAAGGGVGGARRPGPRTGGWRSAAAAARRAMAARSMSPVHGNIFTAGDGFGGRFRAKRRRRRRRGGRRGPRHGRSGLEHQAKGLPLARMAAAPPAAVRERLPAPASSPLAGNGAYGTFAQSVGGGGGLTGDLGNDLLLVPYSPILRKRWRRGQRWQCDRQRTQASSRLTGPIPTAISSRRVRAGAGGTVSVTLNASIFANGVNADGIYAQSGSGSQCDVVRECDRHYFQQQSSFRAEPAGARACGSWMATPTRSRITAW